MPLHTFIDEVKGIISIRVDKGTSAGDIINQMRVFQKSSSNYDTIWDFTDTDNYQVLTPSIMEELLDIVENMKIRQGGKSALVVSFDNTFGFGVLRQYQNLAECRNIPMEIKVFKSLDDATRWIAPE